MIKLVILKGLYVLEPLRVFWGVRVHITSFSWFNIYIRLHLVQRFDFLLMVHVGELLRYTYFLYLASRLAWTNTTGLHIASYRRVSKLLLLHLLLIAIPIYGRICSGGSLSFDNYNTVTQYCNCNLVRCLYTRSSRLGNISENSISASEVVVSGGLGMGLKSRIHWAAFGSTFDLSEFYSIDCYFHWQGSNDETFLELIPKVHGSTQHIPSQARSVRVRYL